MSTDSSITFEEAPINFNDDDGLGEKLDDARQQAIERLNALPFSETPPLCLYTLDALREYLRNKTHVGAIISQSCDDELESVGKAILIKAIADNFIQTLIAVAARNPNFALQGINDRTRGNDYIPRDSRLRAKTIRYDATWRSEDVLVLEIQRKCPSGGIDTDTFTWQQILFNEAQIKAMFPLAGVGEKALETANVDGEANAIPLENQELIAVKELAARIREQILIVKNNTAGTQPHELFAEALAYIHLKKGEIKAADIKAFIESNFQCAYNFPTRYDSWLKDYKMKRYFERGAMPYIIN
jgi:hypothetical protein